VILDRSADHATQRLLERVEPAAGLIDLVGKREVQPEPVDEDGAVIVYVRTLRNGQVDTYLGCDRGHTLRKLSSQVLAADLE
jgi:hypothetical protein